MACIRVVLALSLTRINALSTTAAPTKTLFLAKPTVNAEALLQHLQRTAAASPTSTRTRASHSFNSIGCRRKPRASARKWTLPQGKRTHRRSTTQRRRCAWDALCAKLAGVSAAAVVPRSHADRVAARLPQRPADAGVEQVGRRRLLLLGRDPAAFGRGPGGRRARGRRVLLALDGHKLRVDAAPGVDEPFHARGRQYAGPRPDAAPALAADITRRLEGAMAYACPGRRSRGPPRRRPGVDGSAVAAPNSSRRSAAGRFRLTSSSKKR